MDLLRAQCGTRLGPALWTRRCDLHAQVVDAPIRRSARNNVAKVTELRIWGYKNVSVLSVIRVHAGDVRRFGIDDKGGARFRKAIDGLRPSKPIDRPKFTAIPWLDLVAIFSIPQFFFVN